MVFLTLQVKKIYFTTSNNDDFTEIAVSTGAYDLKSLNDETKRNNIENGYCREDQIIHLQINQTFYH